MEAGAEPAGTPFEDWLMSHFGGGLCPLLLSAAFRLEAFPSLHVSSLSWGAS